MENKVLLLDELGKKYGKTHVYYNLKTPAQAIKLLCLNYPQFAKDLATSHQQGIFYKVQQVGIDLDLSDLELPLGSHDLVVTPVISGSGNVGKVLLGVALIGITGGLGGSGFGGALFGSTTKTALAIAKVGNAVGVTMALQGVTGLLAPQPTLSSNMMDTEGAFTNYNKGPASTTKGADGEQSYAYTGPTNSSGLGKTIPVIYGKVLTGSLLIGADIETNGDTTENTKFFRASGKDTFTINGDPLTPEEDKYDDRNGIIAKTKSKNGKLKLTGGKGNKGKFFYKGNNGKDTTSAQRNRMFTLSIASDSEQQISINSKLKSGSNGANNGGDNKFQCKKNGSRNSKAFTIAFQVKNLHDKVGSNNSAFIDGFITYRVIIKDTNANIVGQHQMTIQGLLKGSDQRVRYLVKCPFAFVEGQDFYKAFIQIIDHSGDFLKNNCTFRVENMGCKLG
tara:strand:- start:941 stop:2290 length:1350 start_codon:yes stop_codon:yes gene_type:complete